MRYRLIAPVPLLACLCLVGCSTDSHVGASRLPVGAECVTVGDEMASADMDREFETPAESGGAPRKSWGRPVDVPRGTRVQVESDATRMDAEMRDYAVKLAKASKNPPPDWLDEHPDAARLVVVVTLDGAAKGERVNLPRYALRPID
jgi:hypothetical protein